MDTEGAVRVAFLVVFLGELAFCKGFLVALLRICHDGRGIQPDEGRIHHPQLIQLPRQIGHDRFQITVVQLPQDAVTRPVGRQRLDIETTVVSNEPVAFQIIHQICDLCEALTFHNDKSTDHGFLGEAALPGCRARQRKIQAAKEFVVEHAALWDVNNVTS